METKLLGNWLLSGQAVFACRLSQRPAAASLPTLINSPTGLFPHQALSIKPMPKPIRRVAVLGAGTMGSRIAAHLANAQIPSLLLDIVRPDKAVDTALRGRSAAVFHLLPR